MLPSADIANRIRALAKSQGLKLGELLIECGTTEDLLSTMRKNYPRLETIQAISERLGVSLSDLISENELAISDPVTPVDPCETLNQGDIDEQT